MRIPIARPTFGDDDLAAASAVLRSGAVVQGAEVAAFEEELSDGLEQRPCVVVSSGTLALQLTLQALGVGPGDEVVVPSFTFAATANAARLAGATVVFADVGAGAFGITADTVRSVLSPRTAAVIVVHLYGHSAELAPLRALCDRHGIALVEDACQAQGATYRGSPVGTFGDAAALSFYATKNVATGEGGAAVLADERVATKVRLLRTHGMPTRDEQLLLGTNARMTDIAAAIGRVQLRRLPSSLLRRRENAVSYADLLTGVGLPVELPDRRHAWNVYTIMVPPHLRDLLVRRLGEVGVEAGVYYRVPLHRMPPFGAEVQLPVTEHLADVVVSLPVHPGVERRDIEEIAAVIREVVG